MAARRLPPFRFVPPAEVDGRPNVVVDGAPRPGTRCTLSHWPGTPTPAALRADLSTESALAARRRPHLLPAGVEVVTVDHADEDATAGVAVLTHPDLADRHADLLVEVARVGDFGVVRDRRAALVAFALGAVLDPSRTPVDGVRDGSVRGLAATGAVVAAALDLLPDLVADPEAHRDLWEAEAASYDASAAAIAEGLVVVTEEPDRDLAVVRPGPGGWPPAASWGDDPVHPAAVHSVTRCMRVATVDDERVEVRYRYETWVRLARRPPALRVDLTGLAHELNTLERGGAGAGGHGGGPTDGPPGGSTVGRWRFDGAGALTPRLRWDSSGPSPLDPEDVLDRLRRSLDERAPAPPAWDPYR